MPSKKNLAVSKNALHMVDLRVEQLNDLMSYRGKDAVDKLVYFDGPMGLCDRLNSDIDRGLRSSDDELRQRRERFGSNKIEAKPPTPFWRLALDALHDVTLIILLLAASVSFAISFIVLNQTDDEERGSERSEQNWEWVESLAIVLTVMIVVLVTAANDWQKERQFQGLKKRLDSEHKVSVLRNGELSYIFSDDLVVGDILHIHYGEVLQADGVLLHGVDLKMDESSLSGESEMVSKSLELDPVLLSGTNVMEGGGIMLVTAVGVNSQSGQIYNMLGATREAVGYSDEAIVKHEAKNEQIVRVKDTPKKNSVLQTKLTRLAVIIGEAGSIAAVLTVIILVIKFSVYTFIEKEEPWSIERLGEIVKFVIIGVTVLVVAVPEGLPLAVTLSLAFSVRKMMKDNNLVRHLDACETMGNATTICSDKTGTLTTNRMQSEQIYIGSSFYPNLPDQTQLNPELIQLLGEIVSINSNYSSKIVEDPETFLPQQMGNKTECALLSLFEHLGGDYAKIREDHPEVDLVKVYVFNSIRKCMVTVYRTDRRGVYRVAVKGAPEVVVPYCDFQLTNSGETAEMGEKARKKLFVKVIQPMTIASLRAIALAYKEVEVRDGAKDDFSSTNGKLDDNGFSW